MATSESSLSSLVDIKKKNNMLAVHVTLLATVVFLEFFYRVLLFGVFSLLPLTFLSPHVRVIEHLGFAWSSTYYQHYAYKNGFYSFFSSLGLC